MTLSDITSYNTIILDRDGVINKHTDKYVLKREYLIILTEAITAINAFLSENKSIFVATNQSPVGRGLMTFADLEEIHHEINEKLIRPIQFFVCPHTPEDNCNCRKPLPGLLERIKQQSKGPWVFVGDNVTDCLAAERAEIDFIFINSNFIKDLDMRRSEKYAIYENLYDLWIDMKK